MEKIIKICEHFEMPKELKTQVWQDKNSYLFLNAKLPEKALQQWQKVWKAQARESEIGLLTSGTRSCGKLIILTKEAILYAAEQLNTYCQLTNKDVFMASLPCFHIGGLAIWARAFLLNSRVEPLRKWSLPEAFEVMRKTTVASFVPTQVFDLVCADAVAPSSLRQVFIGGAKASSDLLYQARQLGWPLRLTYGMTEASSQVALSDCQDARLWVLPHVQVRQTDKGCLALKSKALFADCVQGPQSVRCSNKINQWYESEDRCQLIMNEGRIEIKLMGRGDDFIKILGESVSLQAIQEELSSYGLALEEPWSLIAQENKRSGFEIVCVVESHWYTKARDGIQVYNAKAPGFARIGKILSIEKLPRTSLGKISHQQLRQMIKEKSEP